MTDAGAEPKLSTEDQAKALGVKTSKVNTGRYRGKDTEKEAKRHEKLVAKRTDNRIAKAKIAAKMKPIDKRRALIEAKMKAEKACPQRRYSDKSLKNLIAELKIIKSSPKAWKQATKNGTKAYPITPAKKKTVMQEINEMDLD